MSRSRRAGGSRLIRRGTPIATVFAVALTAVCLSVGAGPAGAAGRAQVTENGASVDPIERPAEPVPGRYIVTLHEPAPVAEVHAQAETLADEHDGTVLYTYSAALTGFSVEMSEADAIALSQDPAVASVTQDGYVHADATESPAPWGHDRVDQRSLPLDNSFTYQSDGSGTTVYVIDSGIRTSHTDFEGRATVGVDLVGDGFDGQDCSGHGTHVASTIGGEQYGIAKNVKLVSVRVLNCAGSGTYATTIAGVDWVTAHHQSPAVVNMSLGGASSANLDSAVQASIASGVTYVVAAGNDHADACQDSPARVPAAITVAATDTTDTRASFSNLGTCVDIFAPGVGIVAAASSSDTATATKSGTSMASPHVAAAVAMYLSSNPAATPAQVHSAIVANATRDRVVNPGLGSPNALEFVGFIGSPPPPPVTPLTRIFGQDAIGTSLAISQAMFADSSATAVVLARSDHFADALAGGPLAAAKSGPLLITPGAGISADLDQRVLAEIRRILPPGRTVYVLGGKLALSSEIDRALQGLGYVVVRVAGPNQFATAVAIANELGNPTTVFEATGSSFPDALSAVPAAIQAHGAILLTQDNTQAPETAAYLAAHPPVTRYAIGGPLAAAGADPLAVPVYGQDLFSTSAVVANAFFPNASTIGVATGLDFPDALSGGVFMGAPGHVGPMVLVLPSSPIPASIVAYLTRNAGTTLSYLFGGPLAVGDDVASFISRL